MSEKPRRVSEAEVEAVLPGLGGWSVKKGKLHREFRFADFVEAFGFMASAALVAESMNHHPEWSNVYQTVRIDLTTHDLGGISSLDLGMAKRLETLARSRGAS
jgi:4a-hydroxytetrahydrobiopterin dehydratase